MVLVLASVAGEAAMMWEVRYAGWRGVHGVQLIDTQCREEEGRWSEWDLMGLWKFRI
jgi:hypothetical protein